MCGNGEIAGHLHEVHILVWHLVIVCTVIRKLDDWVEVVVVNLNKWIFTIVLSEFLKVFLYMFITLILSVRYKGIGIN